MNVLIASVFLLLALILGGFYFISSYRGLNQSAQYWSKAVWLDAAGLLLLAIMFAATSTFDGTSAVARNASWWANVFLFGSVMYQTLSLKAISTPVSKRDSYLVRLLLILFLIGWKLGSPLLEVNERIFLFAGLVLILMVRQIYHLMRAKELEPSSRQIKVLIASIAGEIVLTTLRIVLVANVATRIVQVDQLPALGLFAVWMQYGLKIIAYGAVLGYWSERMAVQKSQTDLENLAFKVLSERQEKMIADLGRLNKAATAGVLAASIAHELSQPLQGLILNHSMLVDSINRSEIDVASIRSMLQDQAHNADRMAQIIATLRGVFSETGPKGQVIDLYDVITGLDLLIQPQAQKRGIEVSYHIQPGCTANVKFSEIQQVILNLVGNAFDALVSHQTPAPKLSIRLHREGSQIICEIEDNGPGISADELANIFKFLKTSKADGMGLGLWLSKYIVTRSHGQISARRSSLGGACFTIHLPAHGNGASLS